MRKYLVLALAVLLVFGLGSVALAQEPVEDTTSVTVTATEFALISVPEIAEITLTNPTDAGAIAYPCASDVSLHTDGFLVSHNYADAQVTATATAGEGNATNDITLEVLVGEATAVAVVSAGVPASPAVCWSGGPNGYTLDITFQVTSATLAGTPAGEYNWGVAFTITEVEAQG